MNTVGMEYTGFFFVLNILDNDIYIPIMFYIEHRSSK